MPHCIAQIALAPLTDMNNNNNNKKKNAYYIYIKITTIFAYYTGYSNESGTACH